MKNITSKELLARTKRLVAEERRITLELIEHLREIDRRLLFAELGYGSLFEFARKELGLSEGSANRRINAMKLTRDVPEARHSLLDGRLSLSNAAKVQGFFQSEKKLGHDINKKEIVQKIENLSQRDCEKKLFEISPASMPQELKIVISEETYEKLQRLKGYLAHSLPEASYAELLEHLAD